LNAKAILLNAAHSRAKQFTEYSRRMNTIDEATGKDLGFTCFANYRQNWQGCALIMKNILSLSHEEAKDFFLKETSYCEIDLPTYFSFSALLNKISDKLSNTELKSFRQSNPRDYCDINYVLLNNKDGKYAWRPLQLIHPAIYVSLIHKMCEKSNWQHIRERFEHFQSNPGICCESLPVIPQSNESEHAEQIKHWWENIEQISIEMSLEYEYIFETDISDCYGSIYSHSIVWALHGIQFAKDKANRDKPVIGNIIDAHIKDMSYGQTNGIPQGSILM
jgi:RNA-directed DNA polymerase